ncbi:carboxylesterase/lipase family protein [Duganella radicis]|uniref:Carboxylic ester hydrolase n=1 Tax=Duganella radicis TaxID=551988 RepID=A0A6L6PE58_9BURK|nr:carboxylesterase family protein [Duganella radicis]MTV36999.1 carboxylesterase family protein [Duganella radicis]
MTLFRAIALIAMCAGLVAQAQPTAPVKVSGGEIAGAHADAVNTYFGIPYAAPPVGKLRWRAPQPVTPWKGVRQATSFSAACAQTAVWITDPKSEDCLYLNIWAPEKAEKLPVMVWIHGGGYYGGTGSQPGFNGANLAKRGAIVVTINYRLGIFGFFAHPELKEESGNQGLRDQIAALRWVKNNIAAFGGDASRVTIFGESAGGISVAILTASPMAKGLFHRAIAQSGNAGWPMNPDENAPYEQKRVEATGLALAKTVGARNLTALRAMSVETLHKQPWSARVSVDGHVLKEDQTSLYRGHRQNDVPLLVGWNAEEGKDLAPEILNTGEFTAARHKELVTKLLGHAPSDELLAAYPGATDAQAKASIDQLTTDWWGWRKVYWAGLQAKYGGSKAYVYYFTHRPAEPATPCGYGCGAGHGAEIRYVFDNLDQDNRAWNAADRQTAARMADAWVEFARSGSLPGWTPYDGSSASIVRIGEGKDKLPDFSLFQ